MRVPRSEREAELGAAQPSGQAARPGVGVGPGVWPSRRLFEPRWRGPPSREGCLRRVPQVGPRELRLLLKLLREKRGPRARQRARGPAQSR